MITLVAPGCGAGGGGTDSSASEDGTTGSGSESESDTGSGSESGSTSDSATGTDTDEFPDCQYPGEICGDQSLCQCSYSSGSYVCHCAFTTCTSDADCSDDEICWIYTIDDEEGNPVHSRCLPAVCGEEPQEIHLYDLDADPSPYADVTCARDLVLDGTALVDLSAFANLQYVYGSVFVDDNPNLVSLDGLALREAQNVSIVFN